MKPRLTVVGVLPFVCITCPLAAAGGLFLPGSGAISSSRAGAAIASTDDGEALSLNPAGLAKSRGTTITISAAIINYSMEFTRRGTYDALGDEDLPYEGQAYPTVKNTAKPPLGFGSYQPVPVIVVVSDLGGAIPKLHVAAGLFAPNAYPFRNMNNVNGTTYVFNGDFTTPPPPTRYDIVDQEAAILLPSIAAAYRILPKLDVGARFSLGFANINSTNTLWGVPGNIDENVKKDAVFKIKAKAGMIPAWGAGVTFRPTPYLEFGANYTAQMTVHSSGDATSVNGVRVDFNGEPVTIGPADDEAARCAKGGTFESQKACVDFALPMTAGLGARYKFLDNNGVMKGDLELDLGWENWATELASTYQVAVDAAIYIPVNGELTQALGLKQSTVPHHSKDTFSVRLGGSYEIAQGANTIILRGGLSHDTTAATSGWLRADQDNAARTMLAVGGGFRMKRFEFNAGFGFVYEGNPSNPGTCNITDVAPDKRGCNNDGVQQAIADRDGVDPINPIVVPEQQLESPVTQGDYKSHYIMFMLGASTWF